MIRLLLDRWMYTPQSRCISPLLAELPSAVPSSPYQKMTKSSACDCDQIASFLPPNSNTFRSGPSLCPYKIASSSMTPSISLWSLSTTSNAFVAFARNLPCTLPHSCTGLIVRNDPLAVGDYIANYIVKRSVAHLQDPVLFIDMTQNK